MKKILILFITLFSFQFLYAAEFQNISVNEAFNIQQNQGSKILFLDVRTEGEYFGPQGHVAGTVLIPVQVLSQQLGMIDKYKDAEVLVICNSGNRSKVASQILLQAGFTHVVNVMGGILSWNYAGLPVTH